MTEQELKKQLKLLKDELNSLVKEGAKHLTEDGQSHFWEALSNSKTDAEEEKVYKKYLPRNISKRIVEILKEIPATRSQLTDGANV